MRCPHCGEENLSSTGLCKKCGRSLTVAGRAGGTPTIQTRPASTGGPSSTASDRMAGRLRDIDYRDVPKKMKFDYEHAIKDQSVRALPAVQAIVQYLETPLPDARKMMQEAANLISRQFGIMNVALGLRGPDGLFRYETLLGFREEAAAERRKIAYRKEEFYDAGPYKGHWISRYSKLYLAEDHPYAESEAGAYNRPILLRDTKRKSLTESLEGDYLDVAIFNGSNELVGWIETSGTRTGQLPDVTSIRWMEVIGSMIGIALRMQRGHQ